MAIDNIVPRLIDTKGGSYLSDVPKLELGNFTMWKKRLKCFLYGLESYFVRCLDEGPYKPKTTDGLEKPEA